MGLREGCGAKGRMLRDLYAKLVQPVGILRALCTTRAVGLFPRPLSAPLLSLFLEGIAGGSSLKGKYTGLFLKMVSELEVLTVPILIFMLGAWINPDVKLSGSPR